jgi:hypothetical protein
MLNAERHPNPTQARLYVIIFLTCHPICSKLIEYSALVLDEVVLEDHLNFCGVEAHKVDRRGKFFLPPRTAHRHCKVRLFVSFS